MLAEFPNDVVIENALIECKVRTTRLDAKGARIISFDMEWLEKVIKHAGKDFAFGAVVFRPKGAQKSYAVLDTDVLLQLLVLSRNAT